MSFTEAQTVFLDENALLIADPDHSQEEDRFILVSLSSKFRVLIACYSEEGDAVRTISARKATRSERKQYQERQSK
ncbi:MAG: BrnT family toxin [Syntrophales bacterium]